MTTATHDVTFTQRRYARLLKAHGFKLLYSDDNGLDHCWQHDTHNRWVEVVGLQFTHVTVRNVVIGHSVPELCNTLVTTDSR